MSRISKEGYQLQSIALSPVKDPNFADVDSQWEARAGKSTESGGCGYNKMTNGTWKIHPRTYIYCNHQRISLIYLTPTGLTYSKH